MLPILKSDKEDFGYVEPKKTNPICSKCKYFVRGGQCLLVKGFISGDKGSCNLWVEGPMRMWPIHKSPMTKVESGYVEAPGGPRCGTCAFYRDPKECELVKGVINPKRGCCNAWKKGEKSS